jgi:hypothetical protein
MRAWSPAAEDKLRALYATTPLPRLAFLLKRTEKAIRSRAKVLGLRRSDRRPWTKADDRELRRRYPKESTADLARSLGRALGAVYRRSAQLDLHKSDAYLASDKSGRIQRGRTDPRMVATQFKPGLVPANKGLRRPGWHAGRMRETQFKKGRPAREARNYVPIGTEKIDPKRNVLMRKVTDDPSIFPVKRWRPVHVLVWEAVHGPVPPGHMVRFRDGMKTYDAALITLDRLELVTLAENMRRNTIWNRYPREVAEVMQLSGALKRKINRRLKEAGEHEEQDGGRAEPPGGHARGARRSEVQARDGRAGEGHVAGRRPVHRLGEGGARRAALGRRDRPAAGRGRR